MLDKKDIQKAKKRWTTQAVMTQIYDNKMWGGAEHDYFSGEGSHMQELIVPYIRIVLDFLKSFKEPIVVCDLGCGDFNIGSYFVEYTKKYIGVDIVESLIKRNKEKYKNKNLEFHCLNISTAELPSADCVIVRQVLQHLSNHEINELLLKLNKYKYLLITEHIPSKDFEPNIDIITGQGIRLKKNSGVDILMHPFNFKTKSSEKILEVKHDAKSIIVTSLYRNF